MAPKPSRRTNPKSGRRPKQSTFQGRTNQIGLHADQPRHSRGLAAGPHRTSRWTTTNSGRLEVHWSPETTYPVAARVESAAGGVAPPPPARPPPPPPPPPPPTAAPLCLLASPPTSLH